MANAWDHVIGTDEYTTALERARSIAAGNGWKLNPDTARMEKVLGLMTMNHTATGRYYCPCKQSHPLDPGVDTICPCPELEDEMAQEGHCFCRLYYRSS